MFKAEDFVHLRVHTEFSLVDSVVRIKPLIETVVKHNMSAVAITDYCNLFAAVKLFKAAINKGIKPILGADLPCYHQLLPKQLTSLIFLCQNEIGYRNLTSLISKGYLEGQQQREVAIDYNWLAKYAAGLIVLSGGRVGAIGQALLQDKRELAYKIASQLSMLFAGRFYIEVQRTRRKQEDEYNILAIKLATDLHLPLVATNDVCFLQAEDYEAHEARVCIHKGHTLADPRRQKNYSAEQYLRPAKEMQQLFVDLPQALANTIEISKRCTLKLELGKNYLPDFPIPANETLENYLAQLSQQGLQERLTENAALLTEANWLKDYEPRLANELKVINSMGFAGYFLIVADFIQWAKKQGIPVGPGRGSGAGSLVAYALGITDIDPLPHELLFERFLNPERVSMPDFDIDFCMDGRDRVIDYVADKYGRQSVSQIITFGTMAAKAVVRDVGRILGHPYGFVDKIAKLIPFELGMTLNKALEQEVELRKKYQDDEEVKELIDLALKLEGITKNAGKHAGGLVIAPSQLTDFTAIYCEANSQQIVSHFDKDDVEAVGLVKFDFLGLRTLTIINNALIFINEQRVTANLAPINITLLPVNDNATFNLLKSGRTTAVFQLESRGMKELILRLQPDCFADIVALVALFRPGPLQSGMVDDFIDRKHKRARVEYPHPELVPILQSTYGVIVYQEQVMQIAQVLANYTLGAADLLRRAMGKKKPAEMMKQRNIFMQGAVAKGVDAQTATTIFDLMEKFAGYGFNKSHSVAYALLSYQTAWLKTHYPAAFMAAVMSADMDNTEKIVIFINECKQLGLTVLPPAINNSNYYFTVTDDRTILYGLGAIKGVGEGASKNIIDMRQQYPYSGLFNFCERIDLRKSNRRVIEILIKSGAMDEWQVERGSLLATLPQALAIAEKSQHNQHSGQIDLLGLMEEDENGTRENYVTFSPLSIADRLQGEKETLGFYLTGHPATKYCHEFGSFIKSINVLYNFVNQIVYVCGLVRSIKRIVTRKNKQLVILNLEDNSGNLDIIIFAELLVRLEHSLLEGQILVICGKVAVDTYNNQGIKILAEKIYGLEEMRTVCNKSLTLKLTDEDEWLFINLQNILKSYPGNIRVYLHYTNQNASTTIQANDSVRITDNLLLKLYELLGEERVILTSGLP